MIFGIGVDMVQVSRLEDGLAKFGEHYADRLLAPEEQAAFFAAQEPARFLAKRFAAKEAFAKAAGTGLRGPVHLRNLAITHSELGQPRFNLHTDLQYWLTQQGVTGHHLSISDEREYVIAFVLLEK